MTYRSEERNRFEAKLTESLRLSGKGGGSIDQVVLDYAWREIGEGRSQDFWRSAFHFIAHSKESNLPTRFEQARSHAWRQEAKLKAIGSEDSCQTCGGKKFYTIRTKRSSVTWQPSGGAAERLNLDQPVFSNVSYRCIDCNGGNVRPMDLDRGKAFEPETGLIVRESPETARSCPDFPFRWTAEELAAEERRLIAECAMPEDLA